MFQPRRKASLPIGPRISIQRSRKSEARAGIEQTQEGLAEFSYFAIPFMMATG